MYNDDTFDTMYLKIISLNIHHYYSYLFNCKNRLFKTNAKRFELENLRVNFIFFIEISKSGTTNCSNSKTNTYPS